MAWDKLSRVADGWNEQADELLADVSKAAGSDQRLRNLRSINDAVRGLGVVQKPRLEEQAANALTDVVNQVLKRHTVSNDSFNYRGPTKMPRGTLTQIIKPGEQVERIAGDLRFDSTPGQAMAIVADLENDPQIESISQVRLTRGAGPGKVSVDMTIEAWVVTTQSRRARAGGGA